MQVTPVSGGNPDDVFEFLNISNDHQLLFLVYIITNFIPDIPHPVLHPHGEKGAGKTTMFKIIKKLCDPSSIEALIMPRDAQQLVQVIAHHQVCLFDNISGIKPWVTDLLAQACTGAGLSKRQLYTDDEDIIFQVKDLYYQIQYSGVELSVELR